MNHFLAITRISRLLAGALCLLFGSTWSCVAPTTTGPGAPGPRQVSSLPDFSLTTLTGESVRSQDYQQKVLVVNFWATWCQPCVYEIPHLNDLYTDFQSKGVEILGISMDSADPRTRPAIYPAAPHEIPGGGGRRLGRRRFRRGPGHSNHVHRGPAGRDRQKVRRLPACLYERYPKDHRGAPGVTAATPALKPAVLTGSLPV